MSLDLRLDEIVLDGIELSRRERDLLGEAVRRELRALLAGRPASDRLGAGARGSERAHRLGRDVALAVHQALPDDLRLAARDAPRPRARAPIPPRPVTRGPRT